MREIILPSGATLKIALAPFADSKRLYQAVLSEAKGLQMDGDAEVDVNLLKDLFCTGFSSKAIETALEACMKKSLYNNLHINDDLFEPEDARQDYPVVCWEVAKANIMPFTKSLSQQFEAISAMLPKNPK